MKVILAALLLLGLTSTPCWGRVLNGFQISRGLVPEEEILPGGPPRDGIPTLTSPKFLPASRADFLRPGDRVIGVVLGDEAKAYPIRILNWHEIVNDKIGGKDVVITYCPLCGTGMVFDAVVEGKRHVFGVSGLLYQSDVLLYDRETESLWSQLMMQAVTGTRKGTKLVLIPATHTTWEAWRKRHPKTLVLSTETGHSRDYTQDPYLGYDLSRDLYFPVRHWDDRYHPKTWTFAIKVGETLKLYPFSEFSKSESSGEILLTDTVAGRPFQIRIDPSSREVSVTDKQGIIQTIITGYWFALRAFYPAAAVFHH